MIYSELERLNQYRGIGKYLDMAIDYLAGHPLAEMENGHYEIDEKLVYLDISEYDTVVEEEAVFEAHEKYADIHMTVEGIEVIGVSDISKVNIKVDYREKGADFLVVEGDVEHYMKLTPGKALITLPGDAHKIKIAPEAPAPVKKAVIKVFMG